MTFLPELERRLRAAEPTISARVITVSCGHQKIRPLDETGFEWTVGEETSCWSSCQNWTLRGDAYRRTIARVEIAEVPARLADHLPDSPMSLTFYRA